MFHKKEYHLENAAEQNRLNPRKFLTPSKEEIDGLGIDSLVKLIFIMEKPQKNGCRAERMWVRCTGIENDIFIGTLDNDPYYLKTIKSGDTITFGRENIAGIYVENPPFDEKLFAIITRKALDRREINWAIHTEERNNPQDSGWQLFYGDESPEYINDTRNGTVVSLEHALSFEPLLESVFAGHGNTYEYSPEQNRFLEAKE